MSSENAKEVIITSSMLSVFLFFLLRTPFYCHLNPLQRKPDKTSALSNEKGKDSLVTSLLRAL